jgi:putative two-component system response regulator
MPAILGDHERPIHVLVADDEALNRRLIRRYLERAGMTVSEAIDGPGALVALDDLHGSVDVLLLDLLMPGLSGEGVLQAMAGSPRHRALPVLIASNMSSLESRADLLELGASDFLAKPVRSSELLARVRTLAALKRSREALDSAQLAFLALGRQVEARDEDAGAHCLQVAHLARMLGHAEGLDAAAQATLALAGSLHDLGNLMIPEAVLLKAGPLNAEEWSLVRTHPVHGERMLEAVGAFRAALPVVRHHHERWDGSGYPDGLAGAAIPELARVFGLADAYESMRRERVWRPAFTPEEAVAELRAEAALGLWDPELLERAVPVFAAYESYALESAEERTLPAD